MSQKRDPATSVDRDGAANVADLAGLAPALDGVIRARGEDLRALASIVLSRTEFLRHVMRRQKTIRTDPRVTALGIGIAKDAEAVLARNLHLVAQLLREAMAAGDRADETFLGLAECLYELGEDRAALAVLDVAEAKSVAPAGVARLRGRALLAAGDPAALPTLAGAGSSDDAAEALVRVTITDHTQFAEWTSAANAELVAIQDAPMARAGQFRFVTDDGVHEFDETVEAEPLLAARMAGLEVYGGFMPLAGLRGYYHCESMPTVKDAPMTVEVARGAFAYDAARARQVHFSGRYLVPSSPHRYFGQYSHGIVQIYARLVAALGTGRFDDHGILLPERAPNWVASFLTRAGVDPDRIERMPLDAISKVEEAVVLPMNWAVSPWEITALQRAVSPPAVVEKSGRVNYYLTRSQAVKNFHRTMVNEDEMIALCEERGFEVIDPLDYSIDEQIALFRKAGTIVTSDSSADTNMLYAPPGAEVIIVIPGRFAGMLMIDVAVSLGHTMSVVIGEFLADSADVDHSSGPYRADPALLAGLLDRIGIV
ncbi:MAG: glycosyltransferase 61 family protein [Alphaproteobacteria bacterium]|nr:glycosyltransferase 61 family protein [Alphaproteobacteria bacterium]